MRRIFICYRRSDAPDFAGRLYEHISGRFGADAVFMDSEGVKPGEHWPERLSKALTDAAGVLVVIGASWLSDRRIDDDADWVRNEIRTALSNGKPILPVLTEDAALPTEPDLPTDIRKLLECQKTQIRRANFDGDAAPVRSWVREHRGVDDLSVAVACLVRSFLDGLPKQYDASLDVRGNIAMTSARRVAVVGDSGFGKSWALAAAALAYEATGAIVVPFRARAQVDAFEHARRLAQDRLGLPDLLAPKTGERKVVVVVDDLRQADAVLGLFDELPDDDRLRLIFAVPRSMVVGLKRSSRPFEVVDCAPFTDFQLYDYLGRTGVDWTLVPHDIRRVIDRPILASVYVELHSSGSADSLHSEYEIFERYWGQLRDRANEDGRLGAIGAIGEAAAKVATESDETYPWPSGRVPQAVAEHADLLRKTGWLAIHDGGAELSHDRLLNWAAAEGLVMLVERSEMTLVDLAGLFGGQRDQRRFGYLMMDCIWILLRRGRYDEAAAVVAAIEQYPRDLYVHTLSTLGTTGIPLFERRLRAAVAATQPELWCEHIGFVSAAMEIIGRRHASAVVASALGWLNDSAIELRETAARVLTAFPNAAAVDRLWKDVRSQRDQYDRRDDDFIPRRMETFDDALHACLEADVEVFEGWAQRNVHDYPEDVARVVAFCRSISGGRVWASVRDALFAAPSDRRNEYALVHCIDRFQDESRKDYLREVIKSEDEALPAKALAALDRLDSAAALELLPDVVRRGAPHFVRYSCETLILRHGIAAVDVIENDLTERPMAALSLGHGLELGTARSVHALVSVAVSACATWGGTEAEESLRGASQVDVAVALETLSNVRRPDLLDVLRSYADSAIEQLAINILERAAPAPVPMKRTPDWSHAESVLFRLGSQAVSRIGASLLASATHFHDVQRAYGLLMRADSLSTETRGALIHCVTSSDEQIDLDRGSNALIALAHHGFDAGVLTAALVKPRVCTNQLIDLLAANGVRPDAFELNRLADMLRSDSGIERRFGVRVAFGLGPPGLAIDLRASLAAEQDTAVRALIFRSLALERYADAESIGLLRNCAESGESDALYALLCSPADAARAAGHDVLLSLVDHRPPRLEEVSAACVVFRQGVEAKRIAEWLWRSVNLESTHPFESVELYEVIGSLDDPGVHRLLLRRAFDPPPGILISGLREAAIRGLAVHFTEEARRAVRSLLRREDPESADAPGLLVDLDPDGAVEELMSALADEPRQAVRWAIGRALRRIHVGDSVVEALDSDDPMRRRAGCEAASWLPNLDVEDRMREIALEDVRWDLRTAARSSLRQRTRLQGASDLLARLEQSSSSERWTIFDVVTSLVDPMLLCTPGDPLDLHPHLKPTDILLRQRIATQLKDRRKRRKDEADKTDRNVRRPGS